MIEKILLVGGAITLVGAASAYKVGKNAIENGEVVSDEKPLSFDDYISKISNIADDYMISEHKKNGTEFFGGDCEIFIKPDEPDNIYAEIVIYSKDKKGDWNKNSVTNKCQLSKFSEDSKTKAELEKLSGTSMKFKVSAPNKEEN